MPVSGQTFSGQVLDDATSAPLEYVNVMGFDADSVLIAAAVTDSIGAFRLDGRRIVMLGFQLVGYDWHTVGVESATAMSLVVRLSSTETMLREVEVTAARKPQSRLIGGDMVTSVSNTVLAGMPTIFGVLSYIPMLSVSGENVSVFGKGSPIFYINNRKVRDLNELRTLQPPDIESIKVITNPGSRYGSDVGSVIVIKTRRPVGDGWSGYVNEAMMVYKYFVNNLSLYLQYRIKGLEIFAQVYQGHRNSGYEMSHVADVFTKVPRVNGYTSIWHNCNNSIVGKAGVNYDINGSHSVGVSYDVSWMKSRETDRSVSSSATGQLTDITSGCTDGEAGGRPGHSVNAYYQGKVGILSIISNFDFQTVISREDRDYHESRGQIGERCFSTNSQSSSRLVAENLILTLPWRKLEFSLGQEWIDSRFQTTFANPEQILPESHSVAEETALSLFVSWKQQISALFWEAGLRYEHRRVRFDGTNDSYVQCHDDFFPTFKLGATHGSLAWNIGYSYRRRRPSYHMMSSDLRYVNQYTYQSGNPELRPVQEHRVYLNAQYGDFWFQSAYLYNIDQIVHLTGFYDPEGDILLGKWDNFPKVSQLYAIAGYQTRIGCWHPSVSLAFRKQILDMVIASERKSLDQPCIRVALNNTIQLPLSFTLYGNYDFSSANDQGISHYRYSHLLTLGASKTFLKGNLSVQVWANDIFNNGKTIYTNYSPAVITSGETDCGNRNVTLYIRYQFNATRSRYKGQGAGADEKRRL